MTRWKIVYIKQAQKDAKKIAIAGLKPKTQKLLEILQVNPFKNPPGFEKIVGDLLLSKKQTLALAESCTGGYISHLITSVSGSSAYYNGSVVPYHNQFKEELLGLDEGVFSTEGAVSEACVKQMATGVKKRFKADYAIATSGIAGPTGGTPEKPVGTVWIAIATPQTTIAQKFIFSTDRGRNIQTTALTALNMLRKMLVQ